MTIEWFFTFHSSFFIVVMSLYPDIDRLDTLTFGGLKNGVFTLKKLLKKLGNPQDSYKVFHVAWTNGKWSICQMLSQVLWKELWYNVGLTTSPHLIKLNERIQINGVMISDDDLNSYLGQIYQITQDQQISLSFFEHMTLVAFLYFRDQQVDYAVVEVGLGGKYDATNVFTQPFATMITTISDDHRRLLGPSLTQVFWNKAGILKAWTPCFTRLATPLMHRAARTKNVPLFTTALQQDTNLLGAHQRENAGVVYHCLTTLWFDPARVKQWLMHITHPGRTQWLAENILLDGAHNEEWVRAFHAYLDTIRQRFKKLITIFGSTKTREEYPRFFDHLIEGDTNYLVLPAIENRAVDPITYQQHLSFATTIWPTLASIRDELPRNDTETLIIVYGSLYLAGEFLQTYEHSVLEKKQ